MQSAMNRVQGLSRKHAVLLFNHGQQHYRSLARIRDAQKATLALPRISSSTNSMISRQQALYSSKKADTAKEATKETKDSNTGPVLPPKYASILKSVLRKFLPRYQAHHVGKAVYEVCSTYPEFKEFWIDECQLPESFQTWFSTTTLYVWMAMVRIRADPSAKYYNQELVDCFFRDAEMKIRNTGIKSSRIVNDTLKDLVSSFKGTIMSLDEGFARSDAVLAAAIWRNLVPNEEKVVQIDAITQYIRSQLVMLDKCNAEQIKTGNFSFGPIKQLL